MNNYQFGLLYEISTLVGHGLGAHIAGLMGRHVQQEAGDRDTGFIVALDPAGPLFSQDSNDRLDSSQA